MAEVSEIEAGGEIRTIKDTTARQGVATNANAITTINEKIPTSASASNKMLTEAYKKPSTITVTSVCSNGFATIIIPKEAKTAKAIRIDKAGATYKDGQADFAIFKVFDAEDTTAAYCETATLATAFGETLPDGSALILLMQLTY